MNGGGWRLLREAKCTGQASLALALSAGQRAGMVFLPTWLGTELCSAFIVVVVVARLAKLWNVVDAVLLGIERYVPLEPSEIEQLSRGALGGSAARAPSAAGTTNPKKRKAAAKKPDEGRAKEAAGKGPEKELASLLRTDFASASDVASGQWWGQLHMLLTVVLVLLVVLGVSSTERCLRPGNLQRTDLSACLCLALIGMSLRYQLGLLTEAEGSANGVILRLGVASFLLATVCCNVLDVGGAWPCLEFDVQRGAQQLGFGVNSWLANTAKAVPHLPEDVRASLSEPPQTEGLQTALAAVVLPVMTATWTVAVFFPAVRFGQLYEHIADRRSSGFSYLWRMVHFWNYYSPLVVCTLWAPPLSRGVYVDYFGWCSNEAFERIRLCAVLSAAMLRLLLLRQCVQTQCLRSVGAMAARLQERAAPPSPADLQRLQAQIVYTRHFTTCIGSQYTAVAAGLLAPSLLLWRRTAPSTTLGLCDAAQQLGLGAQALAAADESGGNYVGPVCAQSLVGYVVWSCHLIFFICTAWGRFIGSAHMSE